MEYESITLERKGKIAVLTLNRPEKLNALLPRTLFVEIPAALRELADDRSVAVLVMTGAGRAFCSGTDVVGALGSALTQSGPDSTNPEPWRPRFEVSYLLRKLAKPTIAAINGPAIGAGLSLALNCDIRIAATNARFSCAFVRRGLIPDTGASMFLPDLIGTSRALEMMFTGDMVDAAEADRIGLVNRVVPAEDLMRVVLELAERLANGPSVAIALTKRLVYRHREQDLLPQLEYEAYNQRLCKETEDFRESVQAFRERREPVFKGR